MRKTPYICVTRWDIAKEDTENGVLPSDSVGVRTQDPQLRRLLL